jgi:thiamine pyrophosphokinase
MGDYAPLRPLIGHAGDYVICVDGGANHLEGLRVKPDIVIGDLDSAGNLPENVEIIRFKAEKDETDTMLAVMYGLKNGYKDFLLLGGLKGRLDHTVANLCTLQYIARNGARGRFADADNEACFLENGELSFEKREDYYISVFPFGGDAAGVNETGFKYGLCDATLHCDFPNGVSNEFLESEGVVSVKNGALLIILSKKENNGN